MSVKIIFKGVENKSIVPRIGGYSFLPKNIKWPLNPKGDKLTLVISLPTDFLNKNLNLNLHFFLPIYSQLEILLKNHLQKV